MKEDLNNPFQTLDSELSGELDELITQTLERREMLAELENLVVTDIERESRRRFLRRWGRIVAFCFVLAVAMVITGAGIDFYLRQYGATPPHVFFMCWPAAGLAYAVNAALKNFSPSEV